MHAAETWTTQKHERRLSIFERKILRRIYGPICERGTWRKRYNRVLEQLYNKPDTVNVVKSIRLRRAGHVVRLYENELPKKILRTNPGGQRERGRPKPRWIDGVDEGNWVVEIGGSLATFA
jgi:hypothetical protein